MIEIFNQKLCPLEATECKDFTSQLAKTPYDVFFLPIDVLMSFCIILGDNYCYMCNYWNSP